jgi:hypothetical protein
MEAGLSVTRLGLIGLLLLGVSGCVVDRGRAEPTRSGYYEQRDHDRGDVRNQYDRDRYIHEEGRTPDNRRDGYY